MRRFHLLGITLVLLGAITMGADTSRAEESSDAWYVVRPGDSLSLISRRAGIDLGALRRANGIVDDLIHPEQRLAVPDPFARTPSTAIHWRRPFDGRGEVLRPFGDEHRGELTMRRTGTEIARPLGSPVFAPANGVVRYLGHQDGYGVIAIIEHGADYATVIGPLVADGAAVAVGQVVLGGDMLGRVGEPPEGIRPYVHVELRRHGRAVDPARLLP